MIIGLCYPHYQLVRDSNIIYSNSHMLHVWYIYLQNWVILFGQMLGKYSSTMVRIDGT